MRKHGRQLFSVFRQELSCDQQGAVFGGRRFKPGFQCIVDALPHGAYADEEYPQPKPALPWFSVRVICFFVEAVLVPSQFLPKISAIKKCLHNKIRRTEKAI